MREENEFDDRCPKVFGSCVGVKMDSRLGPTLTNQGLV